MTRVYGRLFEDGRDGVLVIKPSKPFFGVDRHERHYPIEAGEIDIQLQPTPPGIYYHVAFIERGDLRDASFTLKWRVPKTGAIDVTPREQPAEPEEALVARSAHNEVSNKRLAADLANALSTSEALRSEVNELRSQNEDLCARLSSMETATDVALAMRDKELAELRTATTPVVKTVYQRVPVPPEPLQERIRVLEQENQRLTELNDTYYKAVLELNQLKLNRAQTVHLPQTVEEIPDNPRARLIQKLRAN